MQQLGFFRSVFKGSAGGVRSLALAVVCASVGASAWAATTYQVDSQKSKVTWSGEKQVGGGHSGTIQIKDGKVTVDGQKITDVNLTFDMDSIQNTDIVEPKDNPKKVQETRRKLVGHLKNDDFFNVKKFPVAQFTFSTKAGNAPVAIKGGKAAVKGKLEIRGITLDHTIQLTGVELSKGEATAKGSTTFDRSKFDVKYNSASFPNLFKVAQDKIIKNEITLDFDITAKK